MQRLNSWLQLTANVGVVAGLLLVALELRQNTGMMRAQTRAAISQSVTYLVELSRDPRVVEARLKVDRGEDLNEEDLYILRNNANANFRTWENNYYQYSNGLFEEDEFRADVAVWSELIRDPIRRELWEETRHTYSVGLRTIIDSLVAADPLAPSLR